MNQDSFDTIIDAQDATSNNEDQKRRSSLKLVQFTPSEPISVKSASYRKTKPKRRRYRMPRSQFENTADISSEWHKDPSIMEETPIGSCSKLEKLEKSGLLESQESLTMHHSTEFPPILLSKKAAPQDIPGKCDIALYRRSIENWEPIMGAIYCPKCQCSESPLLRTVVSKKMKQTYYSILSTNCLMYCWPLCFLPYIFPAPVKYYVHCAKCFSFLGTYDERRKCLRPNEEFVDYRGCFSARETQQRGRQKTRQNERCSFECV